MFFSPPARHIRFPRGINKWKYVVSMVVSKVVGGNHPHTQPFGTGEASFMTFGYRYGSNVAPKLFFFIRNVLETGPYHVHHRDLIVNDTIYRGFPSHGGTPSSHPIHRWIFHEDGLQTSDLLGSWFLVCCVWTVCLKSPKYCWPKCTQ